MAIDQQEGPTTPQISYGDHGFFPEPAGLTAIDPIEAASIRH